MSTAPDRPMSSRHQRRFPLTLASVLLLFLSLAPFAPSPVLPQTTNPVPPPENHWLGASLDWNADSPLNFSRRIGRASLIYMWFMANPIEDGAFEYLKTKVLREPFPENGVLVITMEPIAGLDKVDAAEIANIVKVCKTLNDANISVLLRFAHEMNGDWYAWGIKPALYRQTFAAVATGVHAGAPKTAMLWSPNIGVTYPYGARSPATPGSADFIELDTNNDGVVDVNDDPYGPFWPGDQYVDWVGMSLYWTGSPFGQNTIPFAEDFFNSIHGRDPQSGVKMSTPDFYSNYSVSKNKPFIVTETGAMHVEGRPGPGELEIKKAWWSQTVTQAALTAFPMMKGMLLYEVTVLAPREFNTSVNISYAYTLNQTIRDPFVADLPYDLYTWGPATAFAGYEIDPTPGPINGTIAAVVNAQPKSTSTSTARTSATATSAAGVAGSSSGSMKPGAGSSVMARDWKSTAAVLFAALLAVVVVVA